MFPCQNIFSITIFCTWEKYQELRLRVLFYFILTSSDWSRRTIKKKEGWCSPSFLPPSTQLNHSRRRQREKGKKARSHLLPFPEKPQ